MNAKRITQVVLMLSMVPATLVGQPSHRGGGHGYEGHGGDYRDGRYERYGDGYNRHHGDRYHRYHKQRNRKAKKHYARHRAHPPRIHRRHFPPAGYCRVWLPDRAPRHQPPPVHCSFVTRVPHYALLLNHRGVVYDGYRHARYHRGGGHYGPRLKGYVVYER